MNFSDLVKRANENKGTENKGTENKSYFGTLVEKAYSGGSVTKFTGADVTSWLNSVQSVGKSAYDYISSEGYRQANTSLSDELDKYLSDADYVLQYIRANKDKLSNYNDLFSSVIETKNALSDYSKGIKGTNDFYSQFESEDSYNEWKKAEDEKNAILGAEDFEYYSQIGANIENPTYSEAQGWLQIGSWRPFGEDIGNIVTFSRDNIDDIKKNLGMANSNADISNVLGDYRYQFMTDEEVSIYNYYLGKGDKEKADEYLASLDESLNLEHSRRIVEGVDNTALEALFSFAAGIDQAASGFKNLVHMINGTEGEATTATQFAQSQMSSNNTGVWKVTNDLANTTGNMLPSILVGSVTGGLGGALTMGGSASGNAYAEMRDLGYDEWQSRGYGALVGASETVLQYLLGGISKLGGKVSGNAVNKLVAGLDNAIARTAIKIGGNMASEGIEEALQTVLEPAFKALVTGEDYEAAEWSEILYSGLLGALSAGFLEGVPTIAGTAYNSHNANKIYGVDIQALVTESLEIDPSNEHAQRMQARLDSGKNVSGYQLNRLVEANESALYEQDKGKIKAKAKEMLAKYGETGNVDAIAEVITKIRTGEKISKAESNILTNSKYGRRVSTELNPDIIEAGTHNTDWTQNIGTERINADIYNRSGEQKAQQPATQANVNVIPPDDEKKGAEAEIQPAVDISEATNNIPENGKITVTKGGKEVEVKVDKIESIENGEISVKLEGGEVVNASEIDFGGQIGLVYQAAKDMSSRVGGFNIDTANVFVRGYNAESGLTAAEYVHGWSDAYRFGKMGYPLSELESGVYTSKLSAEQRQTAYNFGKAFGNEEIAKKSAKNVSTEIKKDENISNKASKKKKGKVYFDGAKYGKTLNERQKASLKGLRVIAEAMGIDIHIFESPLVNGKREGANGWYDPSDNSIHIDLYSGINGDSLILFTASHELTHHIREVAPGKFKIFADALLEEYAKNGKSIEELIADKIEHLEKNGRLEGKTEDQAYDIAYEEVVADSCEAMLVDSNAMEALSRKIHEKDKGLWETIKDFIAKLVNRIKAAYKDVDPDSAEGKKVREMTTSAERLQKLWVDALLEASDVSIERTLVDNGIAVDSKTDSASLMSVRDLLDSEQQQKVAQSLASRFGVTPQEAKNWISAETALASLILNPKYSQYLDYTADASEEAIKSNSDYPQGTVDFSNICKKRRDFTEVMNRVLRNFPNHVFAATDLAKIRTIMEEEGMEVACAICYVEDRRQLDSVVAQDFIDSLALYRNGSKTRPDGKAFNANQLKAFKLIEGEAYTPSIYELISLEGRNSLKAKNPAMEEAWVKFNNARGMQSVRLLLNDAEYKRQILKYTPAVVKRKNDLGGLRIYSFSDAEMFHLIDIIQVITDSATVGLSLQGYTKVNEYARAVKDTGEKLNRSLIPKGDLGYHMEDGKVVLDFDTVEGIDINHPDFFDNIDNPNIGNIVIGINATQIKAAMTSKFIDQIIPFHTGQSNEVLGEKGIAAWDNYKDFQSERDVKTGKKSTHQINIYTEVINAAEAEGHPITNKVEFVNKFLEVCKENNLIPRFSEFLNVDENGNYVYTEGYHKFLVDFKTFDQNTGEYLPQMPVKPVFDNEYITTLLKNYVKEQKVKDEKLAKSMPKVLDRITKEIVNTSGEAKYSDRASSPYDGKTLYADSEVYDYSFMVSLDPMTVKTMPPLSTVKVDGRISQARTVELGLKNAASIGVEVAEDQYAIKNAYTKRNIILGKGGLQHSLDASNVSRLRTNARLSAIGGYIVQNAVPINGLTKENKQANGTYAMACLLNDGSGFVVAIVTVDEFSSKATKFDFVEITHSINGRFLAKKEDSRSSTGELELGDKSLSTTAISEISIADFLEIVNSSHQSILSNDVLAHFGESRNPNGHYAKRVLFSERSSYAPTFYSHMGKVIDDVKLEKMGASSILNHLKNRGVKDEEIKWSGIEAFLEGKKSVTKAELQEFVAGSQLQIEEIDNSGINNESYTELDNLWQEYFYVPLEDSFDPEDFGSATVAEKLTFLEESGEDMPPKDIQERMVNLAKNIGKPTKWDDYKLDGGTNYRELVFKMPEATYSNRAMRGHWGQDAEGVLVHARIQDFDVNGKKMLFIEELQSDWHNEGREKGYTTEEYEEAVETHDALYNKYKKLDLAFHKYVRSNDFMTDPEDVRSKKSKWLREKVEVAQKKYLEAEKVVNSLKEKGAGDTPDAPFRDNYHEYVLKRLLRMAAEEGYDSIGWTPAYIQSDRWSEDYAEAYRIEYDQDIPKFLRKYGKKWGATVGKTMLDMGYKHSESDIERERANLEYWRNELSQATDIDTANFIREQIRYTEDEISRMQASGEVVWSMDISDSMTESVLYEGQVMYSDRVTNKKTLDFLENQEHITTYKSFVEIDGKLYSPMATKVKGDDGKYHLTKPSEIGVWQQAEEKPDSIPKFHKSGYGYYVLKKDDGGSVTAAYNPYEHSSNLVLNDQFESAYQRPNLVTVECVIPKSEMTSGYKAKYAKDSVGYLDWKSGIVAGKLNGNKRKVYLSRWLKPVRILSDAEVASMYKDLLGSKISVPFNVVPPQLLTELEKVGVKIDYEGSPGYQYRQSKKADDSETKLSDRDTEGMSNRTLLANALETAAQNDIEKEKLKQYKQKIDLINAEEQKLHDLREQIKELSFKKGPRDTEAIKNLQFEANQAANRINTYDRQLLNLESTKALKGVLDREKAQARKRAEKQGKEALERYREKAAKTQRELMERYQNSRKKATESRNKTAMRHKIKDVVNDLNQYLLKGTKDKHVPIELQKAVAEALDAVNMDTVGAEERIARKRAEMMRAKSPEVVERLAKEIERIQEMGGNMEAKISRLKTAYDSIINSEDPLVANSHDEVISNTIERVMEVVGNTPLRDMSLYQLEAVYDMYRMVLHSIRTANKAFKAKKSEEISVIANRVLEEIDKLGKRKVLHTKTGDAISAFDWNNEKPVYAFERIGSDTFTEVFNNVRAGEDTWALDMTEAREFLEGQKKNHKFDSWNFDKKYQFTSSTGKSFELSLGQIMSLYAYSKRGDQAKDHLKYGGFVFDGLTEVKKKTKLGVTRTYQLKDATAYNLSDETLADIISKLTPEQKAFADAMQDYLSTTMGEKGNEVSLELYGVKLFKEKNYFPLKSAPQYLERAREQAQGDVKIKNKGFTKETVPKAKNPIVLTSFMDVWAGHVNEMSMYHAFTLGLEDFYRVFNYKTPASETMDSVGVIPFIENAHGGAAVSYIDQLLKDLNGGARSDPRENWAKPFISRFKKTAVIGSLSVIVQQPTSIVRAMALVDAKYFGLAPISRGVIRAFNRKKHKALWAEVKTYAPVAIIKEMGYFDTGMGKSSEEWLKGDKSFMDKVDDALSKLPAVADELAWISIWEAVKRETAHKNPTLKTTSEEFLKLAGERFTEVITKTQVYDSTLAKSSNMRSKSGLMNMWTSFMAEPTTTINMVMDAFRKGDKKYIARVLGANVGAIALNAALVSLIYAMRDDDEDETFKEKYLSRLTTELVDGVNPITYLPFFKDVWSLMQGFDIERADMSLINDLIGTAQTALVTLSKDTSDMSEEELAEHQKSVSEALWGIVDSISSLAGIPEKNIRRDIDGIINLFKTLGRDMDTSYGSLMDNIGEDLKSSTPIWGWLPGESKGNKLYDAIISGDTAYVDRLKSAYKSESSYESAIRKALRENDPRILEAAQAVTDGDFREYNRILGEIVGEGNFSEKDVKSAIGSEVDRMTPKDETSTESKVEKEESIYETVWLFTAISMGDISMANAMKEDIINTHIANGKSRDEAEASFNNSFTSSVKKYYEEGDISSYDAKNMLVNFAGSTEIKATSKVQYWDYVNKNPDASVDDAWFVKYNTVLEEYGSSVANSGISVDMYIDYKNRVKDIGGENKKRDRMAVINSMPISTYQKDALYFAEGWKRSTLYEAPWR